MFVYCDKRDKQSKHMTKWKGIILYLCICSCIVYKIVLQSNIIMHMHWINVGITIVIIPLQAMPMLYNV